MRTYPQVKYHFVRICWLFVRNVFGVQRTSFVSAKVLLARRISIRIRMSNERPQRECSFCKIHWRNSRIHISPHIHIFTYDVASPVSSRSTRLAHSKVSMYTWLALCIRWELLYASRTLVTHSIQTGIAQRKQRPLASYKINRSETTSQSEPPMHTRARCWLYGSGECSNTTTTTTTTKATMPFASRYFGVRCQCVMVQSLPCDVRRWRA